MAVEIKSREEHEAWRKDKPREWAEVIAWRSALRVVPIALDRKHRKDGSPGLKLTIAIFRAMAVSSASIWAVADDRISRAAAAAAAYADTVYASNAYADASSPGAYAASRDSVWRAIEEDCQALEEGTSPEKLQCLHLWPNAPGWWTEAWDFARKWLSIPDHGFGVWREWYFGRINGLPHAFADFDDEADKEFYRWIVEQDDHWWSRKPAEVNREIAKFVDALRKPDDEPRVDFFISHASADKAALSDLLSVLDSMGKTYTVPVRDGSETRSDKAIEQADRFIALYSDTYMQSKQCEDEWLHAYLHDVTTAESRMLAFRLDRADLKPLMNGLSKTDLTGLLPDRRRQAMAKWIEWTPGPTTRANVAQTVTTHLDPGVVQSEDGKLDTKRDAALNTPELPSELALAMEALRMMLDLARQSERNLSSMMQSSLRLYDDHFTENGRESSWRGLDRYIKILAEGAADLSGATMREEKAALEQLIAAHGDCIDALASADEQARELANVPLPNAGPQAIEGLMDSVKDVQEQAQELDASTDKYDKEARGLIAQGREFAFEAGAPGADKKPDIARKSFLRYVGGFGIKTLTVLGSLATLRSTPEFEKLVEAAKALVEKFYEMVGL